MIIRLPNGYYVEDVDNMNYVLMHSYVSYGSGDKQSEKPKLVDQRIGFFRDEVSALQRYAKEAKREALEGFDGTVEEYVQKATEINKTILDDIAKGKAGTK